MRQFVETRLLQSIVNFPDLYNVVDAVNLGAREFKFLITFSEFTALHSAHSHIILNTS